MKIKIFIFFISVIIIFFSPIVKPNPWLVLEGVNLGIQILDGITQDNKSNYSNSKSVNGYTGEWKNISSSNCKSGGTLNKFLSKDISIKGKRVIWGKYKGNVNSGLTGKKSVGVNTNMGFKQRLN